METAHTYVKRTDGIIWKTVVVSAVVIGTNVLGSYALRRGLLDVGPVESWSPLPYLHTFSHPWVVVGVVFMFAWLISRLALLSWADLTYVLPVTSFSYALTALAGAIGLREHESPIQWLGICVITVGVAIVGITYPETTEPSEHEN